MPAGGEAVLNLYLHEDRVGQIRPDVRDRSRVTLDVDAGYLPRVLLSEAFATLPGRRPPAAAVSNFLGGYVPEGSHRTAMAAKRRIDPGDLFALLREFGGSIAGAVTLRDPGESVRYRPQYDPLSDRDLVRLLRQALDENDQGIPTDSRSTLPGYQPKVLVASIDGSWAYPRGRAHSTHILKPQVPARPTRIIDEHYAHLLAAHAGLSSYTSAIRKAGRMTYLAIERFDRTTTNGTITPVHQEDTAQALGLDWRDTDTKFQDPRWPGNPRNASAARLAELFASVPGGAGLVRGWVRQIVFHVAIGNNDAHAKNVALVHTPEGARLADVYDAVPNLFQDGLVNYDMALAIDGVFDHRRLSAERIAAEVGSWRVLSVETIEPLIADALAHVTAAVASVRPPPGISDGIATRLVWNTTRLSQGLEISSPRHT